MHERVRGRERPPVALDTVVGVDDVGMVATFVVADVVARLLGGNAEGGCISICGDGIGST